MQLAAASGRSADATRAHYASLSLDQAPLSSTVPSAAPSAAARRGVLVIVLVVVLVVVPGFPHTLYQCGVCARDKMT